MFELFVALKYLIPKRRSLSTALISLLSIGVISLVVWLVLVFLSVTTGIEKNWIHKLTALNAPLRLTPSEEYYRSYFYQVDQYAQESNFTLKTIGEKAGAPQSNPYKQENDRELPQELCPPFFKKDGTFLDPVKTAYDILQKKGFAFQDYEISGALLKLTLFRGDAQVSYLTQMSYLLSFPDKNPRFSSLLLPPTMQDLNHLLHQISTNRSPFSLSTFFSSFDSLKIKAKPYATFPLYLLPEGKWQMQAKIVEEKVQDLIFSSSPCNGYLPVTLSYHPEEKIFQLERKENSPLQLQPEESFSLPPLLWDGCWEANQLFIKAPLENSVNIPVSLHQIELAYAFPSSTNEPPLWAKKVQNQIVLPSLSTNEISILLPKALQESGVLIGDRGSLSYATTSLLSTKEERIPIYVAGFYDTGVLPIGNRFLIVPSSITRTINGSSMIFSPDGTPSNGIYVWFEQENKADEIKKDLIKAFRNAEIDRFWNITTFREYEFSKDLMEQFQSDRTLFTLIAIIILVVACSNIISLLVLLVNDKKKEIAVLQSMGSSKKSIAIIFGLAGMIMGAVSSLIGTVAAIFTLKHLSFFVEVLSTIQGHAAFNPAFYGSSLPNELSYESLLFILIITPILSLLSGLIPAIKAAKLHPSSILRASE